jgi:hypothetical protein
MVVRAPNSNGIVDLLHYFLEESLALHALHLFGNVSPDTTISLEFSSIVVERSTTRGEPFDQAGTNGLEYKLLKGFLVLQRQPMCVPLLLAHRGSNKVNAKLTDLGTRLHTRHLVE